MSKNHKLVEGFGKKCGLVFFSFFLFQIGLFLCYGVACFFFFLLIRDVRRKCWPDDEPFDNSNETQPEEKKNNNFNSELVFNSFQALQFPFPAEHIEPDACSAAIVNTSALLSCHFFFSTHPSSRPTNFSVSASLHSNQCNNLIDHLYIIGITWSFMLQSMLAMLQSPLTFHPPHPPTHLLLPPTRLPSALLVLSPRWFCSAAPLLCLSSVSTVPLIDCRVSRRVFKPSLM